MVKINTVVCGFVAMMCVASLIWYQSELDRTHRFHEVFGPKPGYVKYTCTGLDGRSGYGFMAVRDIDNAEAEVIQTRKEMVEAFSTRHPEVDITLLQTVTLVDIEPRTP